MRPFDRNRRYGYDRGYPRAQRPDRGYGAEYGRYFTPVPGAFGYPSARFGWGPIGWAGWGPGMGYVAPFAGVAPVAGPWYGFGELPQAPRRRPDESATYGRGGDRAVRQWGKRYGYDVEYTIRPRFPSQR